MATTTTRSIQRIASRTASGSSALPRAAVASSSRSFSSTPTPAAYVAQTNFSICRYPEPVFPKDHKQVGKTHGIRVASLLLSAHHPAKLELFAKFAWHSAQSLGIPTSRPNTKPKHRELITVIKAPFVFKKHQENFERRHHHREIVAFDANRETIDLWLRYLKNNAVGQVGMRATVHEWVDVGFGRDGVEKVREGLEREAKSGDEVVKVAERLIREMGIEGELGKARLIAKQEEERRAEKKQRTKKPAGGVSSAAGASAEAEVVESPSSSESTAPAEDSSSETLPPAEESVNERSVLETENALAEDLPVEAKEDAQRDTAEETQAKAEETKVPHVKKQAKRSKAT